MRLPGSRSSPLGLVAVVVGTGFVLTGCSEAGSESAGDDSAAEEAAQQDSGDDTVIDWSEGRTYEEQVAEIEFVVSVMQDHFGEEVARLDGGEWDLEGFVTWPGHPTPSHRADDHYYYYVDFDFSEVEANQATQEKALTVLAELGLTPNGEQPETYDEERRPPLDVTGGHDDNGRIFRIEQMLPDAGISASFSTRHSDHQSMYEAHEASWE